MYNSILVPVDPSYSERAEAMLDAVARLRTEASKVILLAVIEDIPSFIAMEVPEGTLERSRGEALQILQRIAGSAPFPVEVEVRRGHPANTILDYAEEKGVDLIVIHSHRPGWEDYLIGSTAARVVRHARCSVHVLR